MCWLCDYGLTSLSAGRVTANILPPVLIERLGKDHARIAAVVRELAELTETLGEVLDWQRLSELVEFLDYYADRVHHPLEDRLFDRLVNKGLTPTERHLVVRNLAQHQEIRTLTEALARQIDLARKGGAVDLDDFRELAANYLGLQRRHMRFEESHLFPLLEAEFDNEDWNALMGILKDSPEPEHDPYE
jgi:hemerythrin-like domain-containing protein